MFGFSGYLALIFGLVSSFSLYKYSYDWYKNFLNKFSSGCSQTIPVGWVESEIIVLFVVFLVTPSCALLGG